MGIRVVMSYLAAVFFIAGTAAQVFAQGSGPLNDNLFNPNSDQWRRDTTLIGVEGGLFRSTSISGTEAWGPNNQLGNRRAQINLDEISSSGPALPGVFRNFSARGVYTMTLDRKSVGLSVDVVGNMNEQLEASSSSGILRALFTAGIRLSGNDEGADIKLQIAKTADGQFADQGSGGQGLDVALYDTTGGQLTSLAEVGGTFGGTSSGVFGGGFYVNSIKEFDLGTGMFDLAKTNVISFTTSAKRVNLVGSVDLSLSAGAPGMAVLTDPLRITISTDTPGVGLSFIPEPATLGMLVVGLAGLFYLHWRRPRV